MQVDLTADIAAPVAAVWAAFTDVPSAAARLDAVSKIELDPSLAPDQDQDQVDPEVLPSSIVKTPFELTAGTKWDETRMLLGSRSVTTALECTEVVPLERYTVRHRMIGGEEFIQTVCFERKGRKKTRVKTSMESKAAPWSAAWALSWVGLEFVMRLLLTSSMRQLLAKDLKDMTLSIERQNSIKPVILFKGSKSGKMFTQSEPLSAASTSSEASSEAASQPALDANILSGVAIASQ